MTHIFKLKQASLINIKNACFHFMRKWQLNSLSLESAYLLYYFSFPIKRAILAIGSYYAIPVEVPFRDKVFSLQSLYNRSFAYLAEFEAFEVRYGDTPLLPLHSDTIRLPMLGDACL